MSAAPNPAPPCAAPPPATLIDVSAVGGLARIYAPEVQVVCWHRPRDPALAAWLDSAPAALDTSRREVLVPGEVPGFLRCHSAAAAGRLGEDVAMLGRIFSDLTGCDALGLAWNALSGAMCPRLHFDRTGVRLLCTYRGPGTEWLLDQGVDRTDLPPAGATVAASALRQAPVGAVVLLKGSGFPGNAGLGAVHRSPPVSVGTAPRLLLVLDALWD